MSDATELVATLFAQAQSMYNILPAPDFVHIQENGMDPGTRELFINGDITPEFGQWITNAMRYLEKKNHDPITIWVNTPGGDMDAMFTYHDLVRTSPCKVTTIGIGQVCSAGVLMLACGHRRLVSESCVLMWHRSEGGIYGNLEQIESQAKVHRFNEEHWAQLMARYTPRDSKYWFEIGKKKAELWICGGNEIVTQGLADEVLTKDVRDSLFKKT